MVSLRILITTVSLSVLTAIKLSNVSIGTAPPFGIIIPPLDDDPIATISQPFFTYTFIVAVSCFGSPLALSTLALSSLTGLTGGGSNLTTLPLIFPSIT